MGLTVEEALAYGGAVLAVAVLMAWRVLRPFERERRARRAEEHAAE